MWTLQTFRKIGSKAGRENSLEGIKGFRVVSQRTRMPRERSKINESTLQKLLRMPRRLEKEILMSLYFSFGKVI